MKVADLEKQQEIFYQLINQVEIDYHLYFGLKSIQKRLDHTESIYDHFTLDSEVGVVFNADSDLPEEIREIIIRTYHEVF
jgi:hypothetical protein